MPSGVRPCQSVLWELVPLVAPSSLVLGLSPRALLVLAAGQKLPWEGARVSGDEGQSPESMSLLTGMGSRGGP